jgi:hypothetical protein
VEFDRMVADEAEHSSRMCELSVNINVILNDNVVSVVDWGFAKLSVGMSAWCIAIARIKACGVHARSTDNNHNSEPLLTNLSEGVQINLNNHKVPNPWLKCIDWARAFNVASRYGA